MELFTTQDHYETQSMTFYGIIWINFMPSEYAWSNYYMYMQYLDHCTHAAEVILQMLLNYSVILWI